MFVQKWKLRDVGEGWMNNKSNTNTRRCVFLERGCPDTMSSAENSLGFVLQAKKWIKRENPFTHKKIIIFWNSSDLFKQGNTLWALLGNVNQQLNDSVGVSPFVIVLQNVRHNEWQQKLPKKQVWQSCYSMQFQPWHQKCWIWCHQGNQ